MNGTTAFRGAVDPVKERAASWRSYERSMRGPLLKPFIVQSNYLSGPGREFGFSLDSCPPAQKASPETYLANTGDLKGEERIRSF